MSDVPVSPAHRQLTAQQLKDAYAAGERDFREVILLRESFDIRANLRGANLRGADLYGANLRGANLRGANLRGADLYGADLYGANLRGANLRGADLRGADLRGADLYGAKRVVSARVPGMSSRGCGNTFDATYYKDRLVVYAGCFEGSPEEFRMKVAKTHGDNIHAQLYLAQLAVFELAWQSWLSTLPQPKTVEENKENSND